MLSAVAFSTLFLTSYLIYHYHVGSVPFKGQGPVAFLYFLILISHVLLAMVIVPLVGLTLFNAAKKRFETHKKWAKITWPLWTYVSFTGIVVYLMLYVFFN